MVQNLSETKGLSSKNLLNFPPNFVKGFSKSCLDFIHFAWYRQNAKCLATFWPLSN